MKIAQLLILVLAFFTIKPVSAGLLLEPVLGYSMVTRFKVDDGDSAKGSGPSIGGRIGYQNLGLQLGLDYLRSTYNLDDNDYKEDVTASEWAGFVGFEFPILFRVYAGYIFSANGESQYDGGSGKQKLTFSEGSGMKFGVGFTGLPFIDINFEYRRGTYGEYKLGSTKETADTDFNAYMISLSLPFVL
jgi:hypothetical protein